MHCNQQDKTTDNAPGTSQYRNTLLLLGIHKGQQQIDLLQEQLQNT